MNRWGWRDRQLYYKASSIKVNGGISEVDIKVFIVRVFLLYHMLEIVHNKMLEKNSNFFFFLAESHKLTQKLWKIKRVRITKTILKKKKARRDPA